MKAHIHTPPLGGIRITDPLFGHYADMVARKLIPYQWEILNDRVPGTEKSYCVANFRIAAGELNAERKGAVFCDTDAYKWLETLAYCRESGKASEFEEIADEFIELIGRAQESDGYLNTYYSVLCPEKKWTNLSEGHELYGAGHLIEAAVAYYNATGKDRLLNIARRFADLICSVFGDGAQQHHGYPGHQEIELALIRLGRVTGDRRYIEKARYFLSVRGREPNYILEEIEGRRGELIFPEFRNYDVRYSQAHLPPVEQTTAEGHAVRAMYMYSAMADVAREFGDGSMKAACRALWKNITEKRMYITGGVGSSGHLERFTTDYDLPNDRMYCESCASVGLMMFGRRMAALTGDAGYYDAVERALCNTVLAGIAAEGDRYFYVNPLEVWPDNCLPNTSMEHVKPVRQPWFACACCPPNIARTLASVGQYIYAQDEKSIYINLFISSVIETRMQSAGVKISMVSDVPGGIVDVSILSDAAQSFTLRVRIPEYFKNCQFTLEGRSISPVIENGYAVLAVSRAGEQKLRITGTVKPEWTAANTHVRADAGKIALQYGPYVYCLEETDNGPELPDVFVSASAEIRAEEPVRGLPGNLPVLSFDAKRLSSGVEDRLYGTPAFALRDVRLKAVPYGLWCNREPGEMLVWLNGIISL